MVTTRRESAMAGGIESRRGPVGESRGREGGGARRYYSRNLGRCGSLARTTSIYFLVGTFTCAGQEREQHNHITPRGLLFPWRQYEDVVGSEDGVVEVQWAEAVVAHGEEVVQEAEREAASLLLERETRLTIREYG